MTAPSRSPDTRARPNHAKNRALLVVSVAMLGAGLGLVGLGLQRDWGFMAMVGSGLLAVIGTGWVIGLVKGGGAATADCPHCGAALHFTHIESARTLKCEACGEWSAGTEHMAPLTADHVATLPVFEIPLPVGELRWPLTASGAQRCPVCGEAATRAIEVQATSALGDAFAALSPVSVQRVHSLRVPACAKHDDGIWIDLDDEQEGLVLQFRSYPYFNEFVALAAGGGQASATQPEPDAP